MNKLNVVFGLDRGYQSAIQAALNVYNDIEGNKTYHERHITSIKQEDDSYMYMCEIWFTLRTPVQEEPKQEFIGSTNIDPSDPNWRDKWESRNTTFEELMTGKQDTI